MAQINRSALVMFSAQQMFELVNDVQSYPEFLPGCISTRVLDAAGDEITASVDVSKAGIRKTFTTRNQLRAHEKIDMELVEGPFRRLIGRWTFTPLDVDACKVSLHLDFEFTSKLVEMAFGKIFKELAGSMVDAFTQRAKQIYGC